MKTATVGEVQKNFAAVLKSIEAGEEITVVKRGKAVARIVAIGPVKQPVWPDFAALAVALEGKPASQILLDDRAERI